MGGMVRAYNMLRACSMLRGCGMPKGRGMLRGASRYGAHGIGDGLAALREQLVRDGDGDGHLGAGDCDGHAAARRGRLHLRVGQLLLQLLHLDAHLGASGASVYDPGAQS